MVERLLFEKKSRRISIFFSGKNIKHTKWILVPVLWAPYIFLMISFSAYVFFFFSVAELEDLLNVFGVC